MRRRYRTLVLLVVLALLAAACGSDGGESTTTDAPGAETTEPSTSTTPGETESTEAEAAGEPIKIGWITDADSVSRDTYFPEFEGASLFFAELNESGGVNGQPVELIMENIQTDPGLATTAVTKLIEQDEVLMVAGGTLEGLLPPQFEVVREAGVPYLTGHSARPDMFGPDPDPLLFTVGNVFEAMSDARVDVWPLLFAEEFPDGGSMGCYIHDAPAAVAVCDRWLEQQELATPEWETGVIVKAPLQTTDFTSFVRPAVDDPPTAMFDISIASHAVGVAVAMRNLGYEGPLVFSMTATPEQNIQQVVDQVGGDDIYAISNITSIHETEVDEIQSIISAADERGTDIPPNSATVNGWLMGMVIADSLERCGEDCDRAAMRDALEETDLDTQGLTGGPLAYSPSDHMGKRYWTGYQWDVDSGQLIRDFDEWVEFNPSTDLLAPLG